jgi:hypothetical protein
LDAKLPGFVTAGSHNSSLPVATNDQRFAFQRRVFQQFYGNKKSVQVKVGNMSGSGRHGSKILLSKGLPYI